MTGPNTSPEVCAQVGQLLLDPKRPLKERWVRQCGNTINNIVNNNITIYDTIHNIFKNIIT